MNVIQHIKELLTNRYLTVLCSITILLAIAFIIYLAIRVQPSDLQLVTHYTAYGVTHLYRDQWFYLLTFAGFAVLVAFFHTALAVKMYTTKGSPLALMVAWSGVAIMLFAWVTALSIINVWSPL